jgi:hypothetical protein
MIRIFKVGGNIKIGCRKTKFEHLDWIYLTQDGAQQCVCLIRHYMTFGVHKRQEVSKLTE